MEKKYYITYIIKKRKYLNYKKLYPKYIINSHFFLIINYYLLINLIKLLCTLFIISLI